ncbi:MAG: PAS domain-containing protein [Reyranella sp.]|uniref:sensor histidine kinase n=1 Tax=Reyranella sp. TaxID=1929291 RepID=UPI001AD492AA|nr:HWE histidine kinase domain-containing protein [Reyranella sp.]MBN9086266.1 PAS domain-containing protein [Reyranella sp.]
MSAAPGRRRAWPAALHLVLFGVIIAVPLLVLLAALLYRSAVQEHHRLERLIGQELDELVVTIDRDIERRTAVLQTLATAPALDARDWAAFHAQAKASLGRNYLVLVDTEGRQLLNTYLPYGEAPTLTGDPATLEEVRRTMRPVVSDLFTSFATRGLVFNISIPIVRDGRLLYVMSLGLFPDDLLGLLLDQRLDAGWITAIWDRNGTIMARSRDSAQWLGKPAPAHWRQQAMGLVADDRSLEDEEVLARAGRVRLAGWTVRVSFPARQIDAQIRESLWLWISAVVMVVGFTGLAAYVFGWFFTKPLARAAEAAASLGRGDPVALPDGPVAEVNAVGHALSETQRELEASRLALRYSEQLLGTAADAAQFGAHQYDAVNDRVYRSPQIRQILGAAPGDERNLEAAFDFVHPDDRDQVRWRKRQILEQEDQYQLTYRIRRPDGEVRWVMDRGQVERDSRGKALRVIGVLVDITDLKASEQRQRLLFDELNHRVKNTLAIVQSLALQTLRSSPDPQAFGKAFGERLQSLSRAHDLLAETAWQGAPITRLVTAVLEPFSAQNGRVEIAGEAVDLPANTTITLALMLNELATNAAKYGALSGGTGKVSITWTVKPVGKALAIDLAWREQDGPTIAPPQRRGFGARLLAASAHQIQGALDIQYPATGVNARLWFSVPVNAGASRDQQRP